MVMMTQCGSPGPETAESVIRPSGQQEPFSWCLPCSKSPAASPPEEDTDVTSLRMVLISMGVYYTLHGSIFLKCHHSFAPLDWTQSYGCLAAVSLRVNHSLPKMMLKLPCPFCFAAVLWASAGVWSRGPLAGREHLRGLGHLCWRGGETALLHGLKEK